MSQNFAKKKLKFPSNTEFRYITDDWVYIFGDVNKKD